MWRFGHGSLLLVGAANPGMASNDKSSEGRATRRQVASLRGNASACRAMACGDLPRHAAGLSGMLPSHPAAAGVIWQPLVRPWIESGPSAASHASAVRPRQFFVSTFGHELEEESGGERMSRPDEFLT